MTVRTITKLLVVLALPGAMGCQYSSQPWKKGVTVPAHLYAYNAATLYDTIREKGFKGEGPDYYKLGQDVFNPKFEFFNAGRNAAGTKIIVRDTTATGPAYVFAAGGDAPAIVQNPHGTPYWLDENAEIVAWQDARDRQTIHLATGGTITSRDGYLSRGFDPSGRYYFDCADGYVYLWDVTALDEPLIDFVSDHKVSSVEETGGRFYVLETFGPGWRLDTGSWHRGLSQQFRVFEQTSRGWWQVDRIELPEDRFVVDRDRWSNWILLTDDDQFYTARTKSIYNAETKEHIALGAVSMGLPLFLQEDVLGRDRLAEYKQRGATAMLDGAVARN